MDVIRFRGLVIESATGELNMLAETIGGMVQGSAALSVGDDFVLFSSAKFEPEKIDVSQRVGLDLILPMATILPLQRHLAWAKNKAVTKVPDKVIDNLLDGLGSVATMVATGALLLPKPFAFIAVALGKAGDGTINALVQGGKEKVLEMKKAAIAKGDHLAAVLASLRLRLEEGEEKRVLHRSKL